MSYHRLIIEAVETKIRTAVGELAIITTPGAEDEGARTWPARLVTSPGYVHGFVIRRKSIEAFESRHPHTAETRTVLEVKAYRTKADIETNKTFFDEIEEIVRLLAPESSLELSNGKHVKVTSSRFDDSEQSPQESVVLLYSLGTLTFKYTNLC